MEPEEAGGRIAEWRLSGRRGEEDREEKEKWKERGGDEEGGRGEAAVHSRMPSPDTVTDCGCCIEE